MTNFFELTITSNSPKTKMNLKVEINARIILYPLVAFIGSTLFGYTDYWWYLAGVAVVTELVASFIKSRKEKV